MPAPVVAAVGAASARALAIRALGTLAVKSALGLESDEEKEQPLSFSVSSSAISHLAWKDEVITVTFVQAPSIGRYFNQYIR
jgi:hypothetical protein